MAKGPRKRNFTPSSRRRLSVSDGSRVSPGSECETETVAALKGELDEARQRLSEALEQQTATSEVLVVISSSPGELEPVFHSILANATRICEAYLGSMVLCEGDSYRIVALHGAPRAYAEQRRREPVVKRGPGTMLDQIAKTKQPVHILISQRTENYRPHLLNSPERGLYLWYRCSRTTR
jgi:hypothetical protein